MHPLEKFRYCPMCGSSHFDDQDPKSKRCAHCGFEYYLNPSSATAAFIFNERNELLVLRRKHDPGRGMLDLPGGFADIHETSEQAVAREVLEETNLEVQTLRYLFSLPNKYTYSNFDIPTLDMFFLCTVKDTAALKADDDAEECFWLPLQEIHTEQFALRSIRKGLLRLLEAPQEWLKR